MVMFRGWPLVKGDRRKISTSRGNAAGALISSWRQKPFWQWHTHTHIQKYANALINLHWC